MKRLIAIILCALMLAAMTACTPTPSHTHTHNHGDVPPRGELNLVPEAKDATGSIFLGTWNVSAKESIMEKITYQQNGTVQIFFGTSQLGGVFFDDGSKVSMYISQQLLEGTYTVDNGVITIITEDDVLVLTKA